jgi:hypothetical protein
MSHAQNWTVKVGDNFAALVVRCTDRLPVYTCLKLGCTYSRKEASDKKPRHLTREVNKNIEATLFFSGGQETVMMRQR